MAVDVTVAVEIEHLVVVCVAKEVAVDVEIAVAVETDMIGWVKVAVEMAVKVTGGAEIVVVAIKGKHPVSDFKGQTKSAGNFSNPVGRFVGM